MRLQFAKTVYDTLKEDSQAAILIGDISHHLLRETEKDFTRRFHNLGICEQSMVGIAAGMSIEGIRPIIHTIAPFCVERAFEQIKIDLSYQNLAASIVTVGSSFDYASLGCTHHCYEDVSLMRTLPGMQVFVPGTSEEFDRIFKKTWKEPGPKYFKLSTKEHHQSFVKCEPRELVKVKESSSKKVVIVNGHLLDETVESDVDCTILYTNTLSSLDINSIELLKNLVNNEVDIFTIEENSVIGGLGDFIFHTISESCDLLPRSLKKIGVPHLWLNKYGKAEDHREKIGLTSSGIKKILENK